MARQSLLGSVALAGVIVLAACGGGSPGALKGIVRDDPLDVGSVVMTDVTDTGLYSDEGEQFSFRARPGHLLVVYFGYTNCPDLCPTTLAELRAARRELGDEAERVDLAMVTVDPERDTAEVLNGYLSSFTDRFNALRPTSEPELVTAEDAFLASSTVVKNADGTIEVGHSASAYVVDEEGRVVVEWPFGHGKDGMANDLAFLFDDMN